MARNPPADRYTDVLQSIVGGTLKGDEAGYVAAAGELEDMADAGELPRGDEFYATVLSALCYDMAGMRSDAERLYRLFGQRYSGEFDYIVGSAAHARRLVEGLAMLGMGDGGRLLETSLVRARRWLRAQAGPGGKVDHDSPDDYDLFFALLELLCRFFKSLMGPDSDGSARNLAERAGGFHDDLLRYDPDPPLGIIVGLYLKLVETTYERSVSRLGLDDDVREALWHSGRYALARFEKDAVDGGLLGRASLVCRVAAAHEKAPLACLCLGALRSDEGPMAYLTATEQAAEQAHGRIAGLLGTNRGSGAPRGAAGRSGAPGSGAPGQGGHFVATYAELGLRLLTGAAAASDLGTVVIDEACDVDEGCGGDGALELEMLLARLRAAGPACPRIVALTTRASGPAAKRMAAWLGAKIVDCIGGSAAEPEPDGARPGADESIFHGNTLYSRASPREPAPLPGDLRCPGSAGGAPDAALMCACFAKRAAVTDSPVLISIPEGSDAPGLAAAIASHLRRLRRGDLDLAEAARGKAGPRRRLAGGGAIAAGLEYCNAGGGSSPLADGVAFDDERLPLAFRRAVAGGVEDGLISAVVSPSAPFTPAARSPFKTVLLCDPGLCRAGESEGTRAAGLGAFRYERAAEMAGRAGRDKRGEIFVAAASRAECGALARMLWRPARAAASALDGRGASSLRPRIASHLVRIAKEPGGATLEDMMLRMSHTWFWESGGAEERAGLEGTVRQVLAELAELRIVERRRDGGGLDAGQVYVPTGLGNQICLSPLPALGAARALEALKRHWGGGDGGAAAQSRAGQGGGGAAGAEIDALLDDILYAGAPAGAGAGAEPGAPAAQPIAAKAAAVAAASALLELADILRDDPESPRGAPEDLCRAAVQRMSGSFEGAAGLLRYCDAPTERGRAAFLIRHLVENAPGLYEISPPGGAGAAPQGAAEPRRDPDPGGAAATASALIEPVLPGMLLPITSAVMIRAFRLPRGAGAAPQGAEIFGQAKGLHRQPPSTHAPAPGAAKGAPVKGE